MKVHKNGNMPGNFKVSESFRVFYNNTPYFYKSNSKNQSSFQKQHTIQFQMIQNCTLLSKGCRIIQESESFSQYDSADKILCECNSNWKSPLNPTPYCIIDLSEVENRPEIFNCIGFYNSTCDACTPFLIEVDYCTRGDKWKMLGQFALQRVAGWQKFFFRPIPSSQVVRLRVKLADNFDGQEVSLTQLAFGMNDEGEQTKKQVQELRSETQLLRSKVAKQEQKMRRLMDLMKELNQQIKYLMDNAESEFEMSEQRIQVSNDSPYEQDNESVEKTISESSQERALSLVDEQTRQIVVGDSDDESFEDFQML